ncbi:MAG: AsmA family protein [Ramlibacter sp.]|nr:AsmA family protein [Ramlibacter sp.]
MNGAPITSHHRPLWAKVAAAFALLCLLLVLLLIFFPWDVLRAPLNRYVSEKTGRHFEITRRLDVKLGRTTRILADGIEFANPDWAQEPFLVRAEGAEVEVELLPLLRRKVVLPRVELTKPQLGLQMEADGRRSWALGRDTADPATHPQIGALVVDQGSARFIAAYRGADIHTDFEIDNVDSALPLSFKSRGTWRSAPFTAQGRSGNALYLSAPLQNPFPVDIKAASGNTRLQARGSVASLATLDGANAKFSIQGRDLSELYKLVGMVLPATPRYSLQGAVSKEGEVWQLRQISGKLGNTDMSGDLTFDKTGEVPLLTGKVQSRSLDFDDLAPLVGLPEQARSAAAVPQVQGPRPEPAKEARVVADGSRKVLPTAALDAPRLKAMDADVTYQAARVTHTRDLPLERMSVHVRMAKGVLQLDPLDMGVAGGSVKGKIRIDGNSNPAIAQVNLDARSLELGKLFPNVKLAKGSFGKIYGDIDLKGRGNSVANMLGTSGGNVAVLMGRGEVSNLLMEFAGIDGGEIIKFMLRGDKNVQLRCGAASFSVQNGVMTSKALVFDTEDTIIYGDGQVSLATEALELTLRPYPKDMSILSLRSPLKVSGNFASPRLGPDKGALAGRGALVLALAAINPLLGLAATIETGPGEDADCGPALKEAASPFAAARIAAMAKGAPAAKGKAEPAAGSKPAAVLGGPPVAGAAPPTAPHAPGAPEKPYGP